jgi:hypothetical protein
MIDGKQIINVPCVGSFICIIKREDKCQALWNEYENQ